MKSNQNYRVLLGDDGWSRMIRHVVNFLEKLRINRKYKDRLFVKLFQDKIKKTLWGGIFTFENPFIPFLPYIPVYEAWHKSPGQINELIL